MSPSSDTPTTADVIANERAWNEAIARNDVDAMASFMADDWVLVNADGTLLDRDVFLAVIASGRLVHDALTQTDERVRIYGDTAVLTAEARSSGTFDDAPFATHERATSVHVRRDGRWQCVLTHLSPIEDQ